MINRLMAVNLSDVQNFMMYRRQNEYGVSAYHHVHNLSSRHTTECPSFFMQKLILCSFTLLIIGKSDVTILS